MRCLVTGAAGFVGSSLSDELLRRGHTVTAVDCFVEYYPQAVKRRNLAQAAQHKNFRLIEGHLLEVDLAALVSNVDVVFHQAAQAGVRASWGAYFGTYCEHNILATQKLLEACKGAAHIKKIVYASSSSVYGNAEAFPTPETVCPQPVSPYGVTKLAAEHLMVLYASQFGLPTVSLRYFTVYGPRQRPDMAFNRLAHAAVHGSEFTLYGDGEQSRDFTFISDIVEANILAAEKGAPGGVYNIGGGTQATMNEVISIFREHVPNFSVQRVDRQVGDARHTSADTSRARRELGYVPKVSLREGIGREIEWMRSQPA